MIFFDTETTGLEKVAQPIDVQPRIIEIGLIKVNDAMEVIDQYETLLNPGISLAAEIQAITGLTDDDLKNAPTFPRIVPQLAMFCLGETIWTAHNVEFDRAMLVYELQRIGWEYRFPYPRVWADSMVMSGGIGLQKWAIKLFGDKEPPQKHRAIDDVKLMMRCYNEEFKREQEAGVQANLF
jgi:DNA polymerase III epsilon subunit-like protein